jgi:ERF superfamily protein
MRRPIIPPDATPSPDAASDHERSAMPPREAELVPAGTAAKPPAGAQPSNLLDIIARAARDPDVNVEKMKELFALKRELEADEAKRAFFAALARAKGEFGPIIKTRLVDFEHSDQQGRTQYKYEEFADIGVVVDPILSRHGLSYRHKSTQDGAKIRVTCVLSHELGHSEENSLESEADKSGRKNPNQAIASTVTYLQRYTLKEALGIGAGRDDDGLGGGDPDPVVEADDVAYVEQLVRDTQSDQVRFLETIGAPSIAEMRISQFKRAVALLNEKKRRAASGTTVG